ncbi:MAG: VOC family protein, partial [Gemmatimonadaceae bacterium]
MAADNVSEVPGVDAKLARAGKLSYIQIAARDVARSAAFYGSVFGWNVSAPSSPAHCSFEDTSGDIAGAFVTT